MQTFYSIDMVYAWNVYSIHLFVNIKGIVRNGHVSNMFWNYFTAYYCKKNMFKWIVLGFFFWYRFCKSYSEEFEIKILSEICINCYSSKNSYLKLNWLLFSILSGFELDFFYFWNLCIDVKKYLIFEKKLMVSERVHVMELWKLSYRYWIVKNCTSSTGFWFHLLIIIYSLN